MVSRIRYRISLGRIIRLERHKRHWTQDELSYQSGIHQNYISNLEQGKKNCSLLIIFRLARAFKMQPSEFFIKAEERLERR